MSNLRQIQADDLEKLQGILLRKEREELEQIIAELNRVVARVGTDADFQKSTSEILSAAITDALENDPRGVTRSLSPAVVTSMKNQVKNSREDMIEALYPITFRLVASAVAAAVADLQELISSQIELKLSPRGIIAQLKSRFTGRPITDFLKSHRLAPKIDKVMVLDKASGAILGIWYRDEDEVNEDENIALVTAMLAALSNLAEEAYSGGGGDIRTIELSDKQILLCRSVQHIVVLEFTGVPNTADRARIDITFADAIELLGTGRTDEALNITVEMAKGLNPASGKISDGDNSEAGEQPVSVDRKRTSPVPILLGLALTIAVLWGGWHGVQAWKFDQKVEAVRLELSSIEALNGFPISVEGNDSGEQVIVKGLIPASFNQAELSKRIDSSAMPYRTSIILRGVVLIGDIDVGSSQSGGD